MVVSFVVYQHSAIPTFVKAKGFAYLWVMLHSLFVTSLVHQVEAGPCSTQLDAREPPRTGSNQNLCLQTEEEVMSSEDVWIEMVAVQLLQARAPKVVAGGARSTGLGRFHGGGLDVVPGAELVSEGEAMEPNGSVRNSRGLAMPQHAGSGGVAISALWMRSKTATWERLMHRLTVKRHMPRTPRADKPFTRRAGIDQFMTTMWFVGMFALLLVLLTYLPETISAHMLAIILWMLLSSVFCFGLVSFKWFHFDVFRRGSSAHTSFSGAPSDFYVEWATGYVLEAVFQIENVFVYAAVSNSLGLSHLLVPRVLVAVVVFQLFLQLVAFMDLARIVKTLVFLPYALGAWLLYCGVQVAREASHEEEEEAPKGLVRIASLSVYEDTSLYEASPNQSNKDEPLWWLFMFIPVYSEGVIDTRLVVRLDGSNGCLWGITTYSLTLMALMLACLCFEIDVILTKIEVMDEMFCAFTSSAMASFSVPHFFYVTDVLFQRFHLLKYALSFVLLFFGAQMLLVEFVQLSAIVEIGIVLGVMGVSIAASLLFSPSRQAEHTLKVNAMARSEPLWSVYH